MENISCCICGKDTKLENAILVSDKEKPICKTCLSEWYIFNSEEKYVNVDTMMKNIIIKTKNKT